MKEISNLYRTHVCIIYLCNSIFTKFHALFNYMQNIFNKIK